jgi:hypothetical protein
LNILTGLSALKFDFRALNPVNIFKGKNGVVEFIFAIHDVIQIFAMTILIPIFLSWIGLGKSFIAFGVILGIVIDAHDFITEFSNGKVSSEDE